MTDEEIRKAIREHKRANKGWPDSPTYGREAWLRLSDKASAECLKAFDDTRRNRLISLPVKEHLTDEEDEARTEELYLSGNYDIDITIDWNGAIGYRPCEN